MKQLTPAIITYLFSGLIYVYSALMGYDYIVFLTKPVIASSMMFHYWNETSGRINLWYLGVLLLTFFSGMLNLFDDSIALQYVMFLNFIAYSILLFFVMRRVIKINFKEVESVNIIYVMLTMVFLISLVYVALFLVFDTRFSLYEFIVLYALMLTALAIAAAVVYAIKPFKGIIYLMIATYCFIVCDLFYVIYYYAFDYVFFRMLSIISNVLSYYFLVNYFLLSNKKINQLNEFS